MDVTWLRLRLERNARVAREAQRAATIILCRIEPHLVASFALEDAARPSVVAALLARGQRQAPALLLRLRFVACLQTLAALTPTLLGHAASCEEADLSEIANLIASAPDASALATTPQASSCPHASSRRRSQGLGRPQLDTRQVSSCDLGAPSRWACWYDWPGLISIRFCTTRR